MTASIGLSTLDWNQGAWKINDSRVQTRLHFLERQNSGAIALPTNFQVAADAECRG
jgi:hypothetical protein